MEIWPVGVRQETGEAMSLGRTPQAGGPVQPHPTSRRPVRQIWLVSFVAYLAIGLAWVLASPLFAYPDEADHIVRAAGVTHGEFVTEKTTHYRGTGALVTTPESIASSLLVYRCLWNRPTTPATCVPPLATSTRPVKIGTGAGRYFPAYYLLVGWPSLRYPNAFGIYLMRVCSTLLVAAFLASATVSMSRWRRPQLPALGLAVALTPYTLYFSGTVNPNALEIAAAVSLWTSGLLLVSGDAAGHALGHASADTGPLIRRCGIAAAALLCCRALSPLWLALVAIGLLAFASRPRLRVLARRTDVRIWWGTLVIWGLVSVWWTLTMGALEIGHSNRYSTISLADALRGSIGRVPVQYQQMVGYFGWLDAPAPYFTYIVWAAALGLLILLGLAVGRTQPRTVLLTTLAATIAIPIVLEAPKVHVFGYAWQGRYTLPLAVGVPLMAAIAAGSRRLVPEQLVHVLSAWLLSLLWVAQVVTFVWVLRRYQVGVFGSLNPLAGAWHPPGGSLLVLVLIALGLALLYTQLGWLAAGRGRVSGGSGGTPGEGFLQP